MRILNGPEYVKLDKFNISEETPSKCQKKPTQYIQKDQPYSTLHATVSNAIPYIQDISQRSSDQWSCTIPLAHSTDTSCPLTKSSEPPCSTNWLEYCICTCTVRRHLPAPSRAQPERGRNRKRGFARKDSLLLFASLRPMRLRVSSLRHSAGCVAKVTADSHVTGDVVKLPAPHGQLNCRQRIRAS